MELQNAIKERLTTIDKERDELIRLLDIYGIEANGHAPTNGRSNGSTSEASKSDRYRHMIRELIKEQRSWHIADMEKEFESQGLDFNKGLIHQCLNSLRESGEVMAIRINGSNQKYYYMNADAKVGNTVKESYLPMDKKYMESIELM